MGIGAALVTSALLSMTSTTKGFLPPRMTTTQRDAIATPATGLVIYNTTTSALNVYTGAAWVALIQLDSSGNVQLTTAGAGFIVKDASNGNNYKIYTDGGELAADPV